MPPAPGRSSTTVEALASATRTDQPTPIVTVRPARVSWLSIVLGLVIGLVEAAHFVQAGVAGVYRDPIVRLTTLGLVLMGAGLYAAHRYHIVFPSTMRRLASSGAVAAAFGLSLVETALPLDPQRPPFGMSAVGPWILIVGALLPGRPAAILGVGLAAAATWPIACAINVQRHDLALPAWNHLIIWPAINILMAVLSALIRLLTSEPAEETASDDLGGYRLIARIGEGGMGEVWKASHQMLARRAAIKLVRPTTGAFARQADVWIERFRREANVIAGLQSPNTIYLYDFGLSRDGRFYYVMELLDGISLEILVTTFGPQPPARVRSILLQICTSLDEAHHQGLIHRDLKPSNVMLCKVALTYDFVKVLDFGLAKCAACEDVGQLTVEGTTAGTPGYIAPEVALGELNVDARADIYALGCVAYFLLTGTLVFPDTNPMSMALKHVQARPDLPSSRTELPIPGDLEAVVMRCLEKGPQERPATVRVVADMLRACNVPAWTDEEAAEWWHRNLPLTSSLRVFREGSILTENAEPARAG
jgi:serine/threonine-protein kinase